MKNYRNMFQITIVMLLAFALTACGINGTSIDEDTEAVNEAIKYQQYLPDSEIVEGSEIALKTISAFLDREVSESADIPSATMRAEIVEGSLQNEADVYFHYRVELYDADENVKVLMLYNDDTAIFDCENHTYSCLENGKVNSLFEFEDNHYAWHEGNIYNAVIGPANPHLRKVTSIWLLSEEKNAALIWANTDCPIWANSVVKANQ